MGDHGGSKQGGGAATRPAGDAAAAPAGGGGRFRISEFVRWSDVDLAAIICYGAYVRFFEIAETELFRAVGFPYGQIFDRFDIWLPRAQLHFDFRYPARLDDRLDVEIWAARVGRTSLRLEFEVRKSTPGTRPPAVTADGHAVLVAVNRADLRPVPLPPPLVAALTPYLPA
jgi:acyl-CoA thioester hydrolase